MKKTEQAIIFTNTRYEVDLIEYLCDKVFGIKGSYLYGKMDAE